jgi:hypothetical protein
MAISNNNNNHGHGGYSHHMGGKMRSSSLSLHSDLTHTLNKNHRSSGSVNHNEDDKNSSLLNKKNLLNGITVVKKNALINVKKLTLATVVYI